MFSSTNGSSNGTTSLQKPLRLRRVNHSDEIVTGFSKLLKTESMTDVTLICSGGQTIRAHRVVLSTFSPYFRAIFESQPFSNNPCQYPVIVIKDLALSELRTIVEFIYKGEVSVSRDKLSAVLQAAKELEVSGLSDLKVDATCSGSSNTSSSSASPSTNTNINPVYNSNGDIDIHPVRGLLNGAGLGGSSLWKRSHDASMDIISHSGATNNSSLFGLNSNYEAQLKRSRVTLEGSDGLGMTVTNALMGDNGSSMVNHESVRSLLHQPNRLSQELQGIRSLQNLSSLNKQRHLTAEQLLQQKQQHLQQRQLLQQKLRVQQQQQQQIKQQHQLLQQKSVSPKSFLQRLTGSSQSNGSTFNQYQEKIKAQMASRNGNNSNNNKNNSNRDNETGDDEGDHDGDADDDDDETKGADNDEDRKLKLDKDNDDSESNNNNNSSSNKRNEGEGKGSREEGDEAEDLSNLNGEDSGLKDESDESKAEQDDDQRSKNRRKKTIPRKTVSSEDQPNDSDSIGDRERDAEGGDGDDDDDGPVTIMKATMDDVSDYIDEDDMNDENDDYESNGGGIDRDLIFQRQQQLRLQQLQQQQKYQQQIQFQLLQEQQEAKLIELQQQYQQANGLGDHDQDDSTPGLSLDWQEGFTDDNFPMITDLRTGGNNMNLFNGSNLSSKHNGMSISLGSRDHNSNSNNNSNHSSSNMNMNMNMGMNNNNSNSNNNGNSNGKPATPDFLQPRGPGRPRKGNKSNDISPCPECNKVFVRPDVLKLHYRSVHLNERHPCNMCPKIFKWPGDLSKHKRTKHAEAMAALANAKNIAANS